jgi:hypothetical protein
MISFVFLPEVSLRSSCQFDKWFIQDDFEYLSEMIKDFDNQWEDCEYVDYLESNS